MEVTIIKVALVRHCVTTASFLAENIFACSVVETIAEIMVSVLPRPMASAKIPPVEYEGMSSFGVISVICLNSLCAA